MYIGHRVIPEEIDAFVGRVSSTDYSTVTVLYFNRYLTKLRSSVKNDMPLFPLSTIESILNWSGREYHLTQREKSVVLIK